MHFLKIALSLASASICMGAAVTHPKSAPPSAAKSNSSDELILVARSVQLAESAVKNDTLALNKTAESFDKLGASSTILSAAIANATKAFSAYKGNVSAVDGKSLVGIFNATASDVKTASKHLVTIAPKLKASHVNQEIERGTDGLQKNFALLGMAVASKFGKANSTEELFKRDVDADENSEDTAPAPSTTTPPKTTAPKTTPPKIPATPKTGSTSSAKLVASSFSSIDAALASVEKALSGSI